MLLQTKGTIELDPVNENMDCEMVCVCVRERAKSLCETRCYSGKNACYLIAPLCQNWFSHRMQNFFFLILPSLSHFADALLLFIGSVIPKWLWWDVIWRLPELCQDAFSDGFPSSVFTRRISAICFQQIWCDNVFQEMPWCSYVAVLKYDEKMLTLILK